MTKRTRVIVTHHSNSRRFNCVCGTKFTRWPQDPAVGMTCTLCGRQHVRSFYAQNKPVETRY